MTDVLVLTEEETAKVRGVSPSKEGHAIDPVALKDGRFILGPEVLDDRAHADVRSILAALPREALERLPLFTEADLESETTGRPVEPLSIRKLSGTVEKDLL